MAAPTTRKSAGDAFARRSPWPGFRDSAKPSPRRLVICALLSLIPSIYWSFAAATNSGWPLVLNIACAAFGTFLAAYYTREWLKSRNDVPVSW